MRECEEVILFAENEKLRFLKIKSVKIKKTRKKRNPTGKKRKKTVNGRKVKKSQERPQAAAAPGGADQSGRQMWRRLRFGSVSILPAAKGDSAAGSIRHTRAEQLEGQRPKGHR